MKYSIYFLYSIYNLGIKDCLNFVLNILFNLIASLLFVQIALELSFKLSVPFYCIILRTNNLFNCLFNKQLNCRFNQLNLINSLIVDLID